MRNIIVLLVIFAMSLSCREDELAVDECQAKRDSLLCTDVLRAVSVVVVDQDDQPVALDRYVVTDNDDYYEEVQTNEYARASGTYSIITDTERYLIKAGGSRISFTGFVGSKAVVKETFFVGYDCCHVHLLSGSDTIRVE